MARRWQTGSSHRLARNAAKSQPRGHRCQMQVKGWSCLLWGAGLPMDRMGPQYVCAAVRLEVDPGDQGVAIQEWQHVVTVDPLAGGDVDLEAVAEVEQRQSPVPLPDQGVEGAQQRLDMKHARDAGVLVQICRTLPTVDTHLDQVPGCHKGLQCGARLSPFDS